MGAFVEHSWIPIIFNIIFICCYMHAVHGHACTSPDSMSDDTFDREFFNNIHYVRDVCVELARFFHNVLDLNEPIQSCNNLASIDTRYTDEDEEFNEYKRFGDRRIIIELMNSVHTMANTMFDEFDTNFFLEIQMLTDENKRDLYDNINLAIHRLLKSNWYGPTYPLIAVTVPCKQKIRKLKITYCEGHFYSGLLIEGEVQTEAPTTPYILYQKYNNLATEADVFLWSQRRVVDERNSLYVGPLEEAVTKFGDRRVGYIGSDGALIAIIVILWHTGTNVVGVAHINFKSNIREVIRTLIIEVNNGAARGRRRGVLELSMIGGYSDTEYKAEDVFYDIMEAVHKQNIPVHLVMACVGGVNTVNLGYNRRMPKISGAVIHLWEGRIIYPALFEDRGPDFDLRIARIISGNTNVFNFYDYESGMYAVGPFLDPYIDITELREKSDDELIKQFGFILGIRDAIIYLENISYTDEEFLANTASLYRRSRGDRKWIYVE